VHRVCAFEIRKAARRARGTTRSLRGEGERVRIYMWLHDTRTAGHVGEMRLDR
jgi:hypothetical protein